MTVSRFRLEDPPTPTAAATAEEALAAIRFPWEAIADRLADRFPDGVIVIRWTTDRMGQVSGYYAGGEVLLSALPQHIDDPGAGFVLAHELGHLVDDVALDGYPSPTRAQAALLDLVHRPPLVQLGHFNHDHPDADHTDTVSWWNPGDAYVSRVYEAWADLFVAAYAPTVWDGTALGTGQRWPRFVHWTEDLDALRAIVTTAITPPPEAPTMFTDVPKDHPDRRVIERAVSLGLLPPAGRGLFKPRRRVRRAELARALVKLHRLDHDA